MGDQLDPSGIINIAGSFTASKTLLSAVELGLFPELAKGPRDLEALKKTFNLHPRSAADFLDALAALGIITKDGKVYANTPQTDFFLDRAKTSYIGGLLE